MSQRVELQTQVILDTHHTTQVIPTSATAGAVLSYTIDFSLIAVILLLIILSWGGGGVVVVVVGVLPSVLCCHSISPLLCITLGSPSHR